MSIERELMALRRALQKLQIETNPPALRMIHLNVGEVPPEDYSPPFDMLVRIEEKGCYNV